MANINRRKLLKVISAASATAALPFSLKAAAKSDSGKHIAVYIDAKNAQHNGTARQIINRSDKPLELKGYQPVTIKNSQGQYTSLHLNTPNTVYTLQPGERLPVYAQAVMTNSPPALTQRSSLVSDSIAIV